MYSKNSPKINTEAGIPYSFDEMESPNSYELTYVAHHVSSDTDHIRRITMIDCDSVDDALKRLHALCNIWSFNEWRYNPIPPGQEVPNLEVEK